MSRDVNARKVLLGGPEARLPTQPSGVVDRHFISSFKILELNEICITFFFPPIRL